MSGVRLCGHCGRPILPGQDYAVHDNPGASGSGTTVYLHREPCPRTTAPARGRPDRPTAG